MSKPETCPDCGELRYGKTGSHIYREQNRRCKPEIVFDAAVIPDGWALYHDGQLVLAADKWETIGPALAKIMEGK